MADADWDEPAEEAELLYGERLREKDSISFSSTDTEHPDAREQNSAASRNNNLGDQPLLPSGPYPLPPAPEGYRFRPIISPGSECVISPSLIAGRYYPGITRHPILKPVIEARLRESSSIPYEALALEGLVPGHENTVDPSMHHKSRLSMMKAAKQDSKAALLDRWGVNYQSIDIKM